MGKEPVSFLTGSMIRPNQFPYQFKKPLKNRPDMIEQVTLSKGRMGAKEVLFIRFKYDAQLIESCRHIGAYWNAHVGCWYLNFNSQNVADAKRLFGRYRTVNFDHTLRQVLVKKQRSEQLVKKYVVLERSNYLLMIKSI